VETGVIPDETLTLWDSSEESTVGSRKQRQTYALSLHWVQQTLMTTG